MYGSEANSSWFVLEGEENLSLDAKVEKLQNLTYSIVAIFSTILLIIGVPGNLLTFLLLRSESFRNNIVALFLSYLAVFNLVNLLGALLRHWINCFFHLDFRLISANICRVHEIFTHVCHMMVNWTLTDLAVCKLLHLISPRRSLMLIGKNAVHVIMGLTIILFSITMTFALSGRIITVTEEHNSRHLRFCEVRKDGFQPIVIASMFYYIPSFLILLCNTIIIRMYYKYDKSMKTASPQVKRSQLHAKRFAEMVFVCDVQLLVFELPYTLYYTHRDMYFSKEPLDRAEASLVYYLSALLLYTNHAMNVVIYCFFGSHFRKQVQRRCLPVLRVFCKPDSEWLNYSDDDDDEVVSVSETEIPEDLPARTTEQPQRRVMSLANIFDDTNIGSTEFSHSRTSRARSIIPATHGRKSFATRSGSRVDHRKESRSHSIYHVGEEKWQAMLKLDPSKLDWHISDISQHFEDKHIHFRLTDSTLPTVEDVGTPV